MLLHLYILPHRFIFMAFAYLCKNCRMKKKVISAILCLYVSDYDHSAPVQF